MSKIIKKNDITKLVESTMIQAGLLKEGDSKPDFLDLDKDGDKEEPMKKAANEAEEVEITVSDDETEIKHGDKEVEIEDEDDKEVEIEDEDDKDVVEESVNRLAKDASKHNIITENVKNDLERFNKIMNYKYH
jgi:hypothetical protein